MALLPNLCVVLILPMLTYSNIRSASASEHSLILNKMPHFLRRHLEKATARSFEVAGKICKKVSN